MSLKKSPPERLGDWCVQTGLATREEIEACLRIKPAGVRLGKVLVSRGILTHRQIGQGLAAQDKQVRFCPQCLIEVNIPLRADGADVRCGRCRGPLDLTDGTAPAGVEDAFILVSKEALPPDVQDALRDPANRFGKYVLLRQVGQGGIGVVDLAWDTLLHQYVALKRTRRPQESAPLDTPKEFVQSLLKEARNAIRLRHPGIVSIFDVGYIGREYYVAMEYLEGRTFEQLIAAAKLDGRPSPFFGRPRETLDQLIEVARAVDYAHQRPHSIVHSDHKPTNIL